MQTTTNTTKIAIAVIILILLGLVMYVSSKSDGVTTTDTADTIATSTVSTSTVTVANNANGIIKPKPGQIVTVTPMKNPLAGTSWVWKDTSYVSKATAVIPANAKFVITFGTDGAVTSSTDCNSIAGRYAVNNDKINIVSITSTKMACGADSLEAEYINQLSQITNYTFESLNELDLTVSDGRSTMSFTRR